MTQYIDIDQREMTVNGQPVTEREMRVTVNEVTGRPGRYLCLLRNDYRGQYRYADFQSDGTGNGATRVE